MVKTFKLTQSVDDLSGVPEQFHKFYTKADDGTQFNLGSVEIEDVTGLKTALGSERKRADAAEAAAGKHSDIDPEKYAAMLKAEKDTEAKKLKDGEEWEKLKAQMNDAHSVTLKQKDKDISSRDLTIYELMGKNAAIKELADAKAEETLLLPHVEKSIKVVEKNGKRSVIVVDGEGNTRLGNDQGDPMTIKQLVTEMSKDPKFKSAFPGTGSSGTGSGDAGDGGTGGAGGTYSISEADARVTSKYRAAKAAADKAGQNLEIVAG